MTEPIGSALDGEMNSDFVERITMSLSLSAVVAEHSKKQNSQPQNWLRLGADASAIHGRLGCSGCTPAEPYPPNRENKPTEPARSNQPKKAMAAAGSIQNNDQASPTDNPTGGSNGIRGLNQYANGKSGYAGGSTSTAAFGSSGTASTDGLATIATYDQLTTNANTVNANNTTFDDVITFLHSLPQEYWTPDAKIIVNPFMLAQIRGLKDSNGTPIFDRMTPLITDGIVGQIAGFDVVVNKYLDTPYQSTTGDAGTTSLYPMYFGQWSRFHTIVDRLNMVLRRYDQTLPGFITFFGEKRLATSVVDPFSAIRYRSTGTAT